MAGNILSGGIRNRFGPRVPAVAGQLSMVVGLVALLVTAPLGSPELTAVLLILIGPGGSVAMPVMAGVVLDSVPPERAGTASAVFNTFRQVGGAVAIAVFGALLASSAAFVTGMQTSLASPPRCCWPAPWSACESTLSGRCRPEAGWTGPGGPGSENTSATRRARRPPRPAAEPARP